MVRAILEGRKTMTRRIIKPQPKLGGNAPWMEGGWYPGIDHKRAKHYSNEKHLRAGLAADFCPYGIPGDCLWLKETYALVGDGVTEGAVCYHADGEDLIDRESGERWRSSRFMPRRYARLFLEITNVRVERLQEISANDAIGEGVIDDSNPWDSSRGYAAIESFRHLWNKINGPGSWEANPWVWVILFRRINP
jgi:hypothetical protein